jgi:hypothetical protein
MTIQNSFFILGNSKGRFLTAFDISFSFFNVTWSADFFSAMPFLSFDLANQVKQDLSTYNDLIVFEASLTGGKFSLSSRTEFMWT